MWKVSLFCCLAPFAALALYDQWLKYSSRKATAAAVSAAARYLADAEPLTAEDLELAISEKMAAIVAGFKFAHGKVTWNELHGNVWWGRIAFFDVTTGIRTTRVTWMGIDSTDARLFVLGRSYIVAYQPGVDHQIVIDFVAPPPSCASLRSAT